MRVLIEAGGNVDLRCAEGEHRTPLRIAAEEGYVNAVMELLRALANPLGWRVRRGSAKAQTWLPLDFAAQNGYLKVVNEVA